jgi:hypothetical protein
MVVPPEVKAAESAMLLKTIATSAPERTVYHEKYKGLILRNNSNEFDG